MDVLLRALADHRHVVDLSPHRESFEKMTNEVNEVSEVQDVGKEGEELCERTPCHIRNHGNNR